MTDKEKIDILSKPFKMSDGKIIRLKKVLKGEAICGTCVYHNNNEPCISEISEINSINKISIDDYSDCPAPPSYNFKEVVFKPIKKRRKLNI